MSDPLHILALDLANKTGWAFSDGVGLPRYGTWLLTAGKRERTQVLHNHIIRMHRDYGPIDLIAVEDSHMGSRNHLIAAMHAELRGIAKLAAASSGARFIKVPPSTLKKFATGSGRATKAQMIRACKTILNIETDDDDIADALFILEWARLNPDQQPTQKQRRRRVRKANPQLKMW